MLIIIPVFISFPGYIRSGFAGKSIQHVKLWSTVDFFNLFSGFMKRNIVKYSRKQSSNRLTWSLLLSILFRSFSMTLKMESLRSLKNSVNLLTQRQSKEYFQQLHNKYQGIWDNALGSAQPRDTWSPDVDFVAWTPASSCLQSHYKP